jgi:hypothetical protein
MPRCCIEPSEIRVGRNAGWRIPTWNDPRAVLGIVTDQPYMANAETFAFLCAQLTRVLSTGVIERVVTVLLQRPELVWREF